MSKLSTVRKLGAAGRVAAQMAGSNRTLSALMSAAKATAKSFGHVLHQLWLETTGVVFLVMAASGGAATAREYVKYHAGQTAAGRVVLAGCFTVTMAWFGVSSFWRVRRKARERA